MYPPLNQIPTPMQFSAPQPMPFDKGDGSLIQGPRLAKFFVDIQNRLFRDYIIIMDMSGSMGGPKWLQAKHAVMKIAPFACQADANGITLYLFNYSFKKFCGLRTPDVVQSIFDRENPNGGTNLTDVLHAAFSEAFTGGKPATILVVTDGEPDSQKTVKHEIVNATHRLTHTGGLSVSFIQIGDDRKATKFLQDLDTNLKGAKYDIVDTISAKDLQYVTFDQLIERSIR